MRTNISETSLAAPGKCAPARSRRWAVVASAATLGLLGMAWPASGQVINRCYWSPLNTTSVCQQATTGSYGGLAPGAQRISAWGTESLGLQQVFMNNQTSATNKQMVVFKESTDTPLTSFTAVSNPFYRAASSNQRLWFRCGNLASGNVNVQCGAVHVGSSPSSTNFWYIR